jgi:hypothetical protein
LNLGLGYSPPRYRMALKTQRLCGARTVSGYDI